MYVKIKIDLTSEAMQSNKSIADALLTLVDDLKASGDGLFVGKYITILDRSGSSKVGHLKVKE